MAESPERLARSLEDVPDAEINAMTHENAMGFFQYDPFSRIPRAECTVGALRGLATDVDTSVKSSGKAVVRPDEPITIMSLANMVTPKKTA